MIRMVLYLSGITVSINGWPLQLNWVCTSVGMAVVDCVCHDACAAIGL